MSVKAAEQRLIDAARAFAANGNLQPLLAAAITYGKAKIKAWKNRDEWKIKQRLGK